MRHERGGQTIMVVDDYDDTRRVMRHWLQRKGYKVIEAANGKEAVEVAARESPDLILMDIEMPELDGLAATRRIREERGLRAVPIIAVSAYGEIQYRDSALEAGCTDYVVAPCAPADLAELIGRILCCGPQKGRKITGQG